jgi:hypothetical protein
MALFACKNAASSAGGSRVTFFQLFGITYRSSGASAESPVTPAHKTAAQELKNTPASLSS